MRGTGYSRRAADASNDVLYANQYLTFVPSADATFTFTKRGTGDDIQYSIDDGAWVALASGVASPTVQAGHSIRWKAKITPVTSASTATDNGIGTFSSSADYVAKGNPISLLEGDKFIGVRRFTYGRVFVSLFLGDTHLTDASDMSLVAMVLTTYCYYGMFQDCTALVSAPELPAVVVSTYCYRTMFQGCTALVNAPSILPATTLASNCYRAMFQGCTALENAPILPASVLAGLCYYQMFDGCSSLNYITMLASDISASSSMTNWVRGVASYGTFVKNAAMATLPTGNSGIPNGWYVANDDEINAYLTFIPSTDSTFTFTKRGTGNDIQYSIDNGAWISLASGVATPTVETGHNIRWKAQLVPLTTESTLLDNGIGVFSSTGTYKAKGNPLSLSQGDSFKGVQTIPSQYQFTSLFNGDSGITDASEISLCSFTLRRSCYHGMFANCANLASSPKELPSLNAETYCYTSMFLTCPSLVTAPKIKCTSISNRSMFTMFKGCSSLTTAPDLLVSTLDIFSMYQMFDGCSSLNYVKTLATDVSANSCISNWLRGVASEGTFVKLASMTSFPSGSSGIPNNWTVTNA